MPAGERWPVAGAGRADARGLLRNGLHLAALSAFALALPLFDALGDEPEFFALRGATAAEIAISALAVSVGPALLLVGVEALAGLLSRRLASALQLVFVAALTALLALQALRRLDGLPAAAVMVAAALLGLAGAAIYHRAGIVRTAAAVLSPAALL